MEQEPKQPIRRKGMIAAIAAGVATVTTIILENTYLIDALARLARSIAE